MLRNNEEYLKEACKRMIEEKLGWGASENWSNRDYDALSVKIFEVTGVNLSQTTLKRIWGKVKYDSAPTTTTLDTLVVFLGYENWRQFRQMTTASHSEEVVSFKNVVNPLKKSSNRNRWMRVAPFLLVAIIGIIASWNLFLKKSPKKAVATPIYSFSSKKILSRGLPNSVVFEYDASGSHEDSIFIQQSWDSRLRALVAKDQHLHTSIYYYPGFFQAKLLAGHEIVKEQDVYIQTDGWLTLIEQDPVPVYFEKNEAIGNGKLELPISALARQNISIKPKAPVVFYGNIREFDDLQSDDFIFETSVKNNYKSGSAVCQKTEIRLICEGSMVSIPLSARGCISENNLFCFGHFEKGTESDLSGFGVNFDHFVKLRLEVRHGKADFYIDDKPVYHLDGLKMRSKIKGIVYRFQGMGSVDWVRLSRSDGQIVYDEQF